MEKGKIIKIFLAFVALSFLSYIGSQYQKYSLSYLIL